VSDLFKDTQLVREEVKEANSLRKNTCCLGGERFASWRQIDDLERKGDQIVDLGLGGMVAS
jgi:hypothetical protein